MEASMFIAFRRLIPITAALAMSVVACTSDKNEDAASGESNLSAGETNERGFGLESHVLTKEPASVATAAALGIATWDVFVGVDREKKFSGTVFYASDAAGDVKYAFAVDEAAQSV